METASLDIQKVCVVLSGTTSHVIVSGARKATHATRMLIKGKSSEAA